MTNLATRHLEPEMMDNPHIDPALHEQALAGLRRVHWISGTVATLWNRISLAAAQNRKTTLRVLDVACGGGEIAISLAKRARRAGLSLEFSACDISETALNTARKRGAAQNVDIKFFQTNAIADPLPGNYDILMSSLFLHHLDEDDAVHLLKSMKQTAQQMVLVSDLLRSRLGYILTWSGLRLLTRSHICHVDGPLSVRAAFTTNEAEDLTRKAGLENAELTQHWPERFLITWKRP